jgi:alkanesulfonate monooxygenase SsuD/methylene tetrahydromethanopterin reductase-like flavin-dependent oxidoreductase (luciferase family)
VSLRLYPHLELDAEGIVAELLAQGRLADDAGFDGVMTSEHHNAFGGYLPIPLLLAGWLLDVMPEAWAAPCPLLLTLRPAALVAEEVAWLAARFPGRVGLGVAAGALKEDFAVMGLTKERLSDRFASGLATVSGMLLGRDPGPLSDDPAIRRCVTHPVPLVSAAMSPAAVRRAADAGVGLVLDSLSTVERCRELVDAYVAADGPGPVVLIRRVWVGDPPVRQQEKQLDVYRSYASPGAVQHWKGQQMVTGDDADPIADALMAQAEAAGADALNLRVHVPEVSPAEIRREIEALASVRSRLAKRWTGSGPASKRGFSASSTR